MLRLVIYGNVGSPIFELGEGISDFYKIPFLTIEKIPEYVDSYFVDKIPEKTLDMGDLTSGNMSEQLVRNPKAMELDKIIEDRDTGFEGEYDEILNSEDIFSIFQFKQAIVVTEIADENLLKWATHCIYLYADEDKAVNWFSKRRKCLTCRNVHHLEDKPSREPEICDRCGSDLVTQDQDLPENVREQYKNWRNQFWRFKEMAKAKTGYITYSVDKYKSFNDLLTDVDLYIRSFVETDNWYNVARDDFVVKEDALIWDKENKRYHSI